MTREELIRTVQNLAAESGSATVSRREFTRRTGVTEGQVLKHFQTWNELILCCGLDIASNAKLTDDELFSSMRDVFIECGDVTTQRKFRRLARHSHSLYSRKWGARENILHEFKNWLMIHDPNFPFMERLTRKQYNPDLPLAVHGASSITKTVRYSARLRTQYEDLINFHGLLHAPVNEQGVVFLFGMVAHELGYIVESVRTGYPDCEAKRGISGDWWQKVLIEYEFQSRNFFEHGHDQNQCDIIVCWQHNWPECPLEVVELRKEIDKLRR